MTAEDRDLLQYATNTELVDAHMRNHIPYRITEPEREYLRGRKREHQISLFYTTAYAMREI